MNKPSGLVLFLLFSFLPLSQIFSQKKIILESPPQDSLVTYQLNDLDILYPLAGDTVSDHPYYTFLWLFGDGSFINGTRDSVISHVYSLGENQNYHQLGAASAADVVVYAIGNYSGGTRPPRSAIAPPGNAFRSPSLSEQTFKLAMLGTPDASPSPTTSVIDGDDFLRLQLSTAVRPQDTMVSILSFRQPGKTPVAPIRGQLFLFYNSEVEMESKVTPKARAQFKNSSPPPTPPSLTHGESAHTRTHMYFTDTYETGGSTLDPNIVSGYNNVLVFNYDSLGNDGEDERHLFVEMANDSSMWELFKDGQKSSLNFMAIMTTLESDPDILGPLPQVTLPDTNLNSLLTSTIFDDNEFLPLGPNDPGPTVIALSETSSDIVSAHDPNALTFYACECPDTSQQKLVGVIDFSNDGSVSTTQVSVSLKIPEQLNINSLENIEITPTPISPLSPTIDFAERTATWTWPALLQPAESAGMGHPSTQGQIVFALTLKEEEIIGNIDPTNACIIFDVNTPMCTLPTAPADYISTTTGDETGDYLECQKCEEYTPEADSSSGIDWWCALLWALGIILLIFVVAIVRRMIN